MAAAVGVTAAINEGLAPATGHTAEVTSDGTVEYTEIKNESGVTVKLIPVKLIKKDITLRGQGTVALPTLVAAAAMAEGSATVISAKQIESNTVTPEFEISAVLYDETA